MSLEVRGAELRDGAALYRAWQAVRQHNANMDVRIVQMPVSEAWDGLILHTPEFQM